MNKEQYRQYLIRKVDAAKALWQKAVIEYLGSGIDDCDVSKIAYAHGYWQTIEDLLNEIDIVFPEGESNGSIGK